jgi:hypothetical protein
VIGVVPESYLNCVAAARRWCCLARCAALRALIADLGAVDERPFLHPAADGAQGHPRTVRILSQTNALHFAR